MCEQWDIAVDLDGVLYDFVEVFANEARTQYPDLRIPSNPRPTRWEFFRDWGMSTDEFAGLFAEGVRGGRIFWSGPMYAGVLEGWSALREQGHRLHIVTDRSPAGAVVEAWEATLYWLDGAGLVPDSITVTSDKGAALESFVQHPRRALLVDDKPENLVQAQSVGVRGVLMDRPWNAAARWPRVRSMTQFAALVSEESKGRQVLPESFGGVG